jgi:hypothetical protein
MDVSFRIGWFQSAMSRRSMAGAHGLSLISAPPHKLCAAWPTTPRITPNSPRPPIAASAISGRIFRSERHLIAREPSSPEAIALVLCLMAWVSQFCPKFLGRTQDRHSSISSRWLRSFEANRHPGPPATTDRGGDPPDISASSAEATVCVTAHLSAWPRSRRIIVRRKWSCLSHQKNDMPQPI